MTKVSCGRTETCGGQFSSGPGDSDWLICEEHAADATHFGTVYVAQVAALANGDTVPSSVQKCREYLGNKRT